MFEIIRIGFHPAAYYQPEEDKSRDTLNFQDYEWGDLKTTSDSMPKAVTMGTKLHTIVLLLRQFAHMNDHTVIFTQSLAVLKVLAHVLTTSNFPFLDWVGCIEGKTGEIERVQLVERFQQSKRNTSFIPGRLSVLLLSMGVGGVGLTLTAANRAILCDVSWNPMKDAQAVGRIFRFGQTKKVFVYRLVCGGTLEDCIQSLQRQKENMVTTVSALMSEGSSATFDTETLFKVEKEHYFDEAKYAAIQSSILNISASEVDPQLHAVISDKRAHFLISCVCNFQQEEGVDYDSGSGERDVSLGLESANSRFFFNHRPSQVSLYASFILFIVYRMHCSLNDSQDIVEISSDDDDVILIRGCGKVLSISDMAEAEKNFVEFVVRREVEQADMTKESVNMIKARVVSILRTNSGTSLSGGNTENKMDEIILSKKRRNQLADFIRSKQGKFWLKGLVVGAGRRSSAILGKIGTK
jgi:hypothetical protein